MAEKVKLESSYYPVSMAGLVNEWADGVPEGERSVAHLEKVFRWMRGFVNGWYGWSNDGKGTFFDFLAVEKAKRDGWKFCIYKQEDMNSYAMKGKRNRIVMSANDIHNNLAWTYTGVTPFKHFAKRYGRPQLTLDEYQAAMAWVDKHFFVIYPEDRKYHNIMDTFMWIYETYGVDAFLVDPFKALILPDDERGDRQMTNVFIHTKEFALKTNTCFNYISHAKSMTDEKQKDGRYKVVNQFMQLGGSAWDINMDGQFSIYRPERHLDPNDPKVHFFNLKQRKAEIVGCNRGVYEKIKFDPLKKRYYFDGVDGIDGSYDPTYTGVRQQTIVDFTEPEVAKGKDDLPF